MSEYGMTDYGIFQEAVATTNNYSTSVKEVQDAITTCKTKISDESIFMGPIQQDCVQKLTTINTDFEGITTLVTQINAVLTGNSENYQVGDQKADAAVEGADVGGKGGTATTTQTPTTTDATTGATPKSSVEIPSNIKQAPYTVTCYEKDGWHYSASSEGRRVAPGTTQEKVHNAWIADGARYKNGIAVMNVNGKDHYLIATAQSLGKVGDNVRVNFANGQSIPCVIADSKCSSDSNYTQYGHRQSNGSVNLLEFEVYTQTYRDKGNPTTQKWGLEWDSSSKVKKIDNYGSVV